ncbi:integrase core domain-containing protein [Streptomyces sp. AHU1]|uniref:integrase core domain-containing protein n=1 Tax=Streptomyces sp. AHU1 TaxID=3377215 RepID=UPI0038782540
MDTAVRTRGSRMNGVIFHSDHGTRHNAKAFAESFFTSLEREVLPGRRGSPTARAARLVVFRRLGCHNHQRRHSAIGHLTPAVLELDQWCHQLSAAASSSP